MVTGECKFKNEPVDKAVYETLVRRSKAIPVNYPVKKYMIFSLSGFTSWHCENRDDMLKLYTLEDLYIQ